MNKRNITLVKTKKKRRVRKTLESNATILTPDELVEARRFKAMTAARAARQAMINRILAEVLELDEHSPAA